MSISYSCCCVNVAKNSRHLFSCSLTSSGSMRRKSERSLSLSWWTLVTTGMMMHMDTRRPPLATSKRTNKMCLLLADRLSVSASMPSVEAEIEPSRLFSELVSTNQRGSLC